MLCGKRDQIKKRLLNVARKEFVTEEYSADIGGIVIRIEEHDFDFEPARTIGKRCATFSVVNGTSVFFVAFTALVCRPVQGEVVIVKVDDIDEHAIRETKTVEGWAEGVYRVSVSFGDDVTITPASSRAEDAMSQQRLHKIEYPVGDDIFAREFGEASQTADHRVACCVPVQIREVRVTAGRLDAVYGVVPSKLLDWVGVEADDLDEYDEEEDDEDEDEVMGEVSEVDKPAARAEVTTPAPAVGDDVRVSNQAVAREEVALESGAAEEDASGRA